MSAPDELYPPVAYEGWWLLVAIAILLTIAAAAWIVWALTRPPSPAPPAPPVPLAAQLEALRAHHLDRIARVETAYANSAVSARDANASLSRIAREFVNDYTGIETPVLSLDELVAHDVDDALTSAIRHHFYPSAFGGGDPGGPAIGAAAARRVVNGWH